MLFVNLSCGQVKIKDHEFFVDEGIGGASSFHSLIADQSDLDKESWDKMRFGMICESTDVFTDLKKTIEDFCVMTKQCTYEQKAQLTGFVNKMELARSKSMKKRVKK